MMIKHFLPWIALALGLPCFGMYTDNKLQNHEKINALFATKYKITQQNFERAMNAISERKEGKYLAEKLTSKLEKWVNNELSADELVTEVQKSYREILQSFGQPGAAIVTMLHPREDIVLATFPIIFTD